MMMVAIRMMIMKVMTMMWDDVVDDDDGLRWWWWWSVWILFVLWSWFQHSENLENPSNFSWTELNTLTVTWLQTWGTSCPYQRWKVKVKKWPRRCPLKWNIFYHLQWCTANVHPTGFDWLMPPQCRISLDMRLSIKSHIIQTNMNYTY